MTDFFEQLSRVMADGMTVNITTVKKGEKLSVIFTPIPKDKKKEDITPFVITGTGREIDVTFKTTMLVGTAHHSGLQDNAAAFLKDSGMKSVFDQAPEPAKPKPAPKKKPAPAKPNPVQEDGTLKPTQVVEHPKPDPVVETPAVAAEIQPNKEFDQAATVQTGQNISKPAAAQIPAASPQPPAAPAPENPTPQAQTPAPPNPSDQW